MFCLEVWKTSHICLHAATCITFHRMTADSGQRIPAPSIVRVTCTGDAVRNTMSWFITTLFCRIVNLSTDKYFVHRFYGNTNYLACLFTTLT